MDLFKKIAGLLPQGEHLLITVIALADGRLAVSVSFDGKGIKDASLNTFVPLLLKGTPEELDGGFIEAITTPVQQQAGLLTNIKQFEEANAAAAKKLEEAKKKPEPKKAEAKKSAAKGKDAAQEAKPDVKPEAAPVQNPDEGPALFSEVSDDGDLPLSDAEKEEAAREAFRKKVAEEAAKRKAAEAVASADGDEKKGGDNVEGAGKEAAAVESPSQAQEPVEKPRPAVPGVKDVVKEDLNTLWSKGRGLYQSRNFSAAKEVFEQCRMLADPNQYASIDKAIASCQANISSSRIYQ